MSDAPGPEELADAWIDEARATLEGRGVHLNETVEAALEATANALRSVARLSSTHLVGME